FVLQANGVPAGTFLRARSELVIDTLLTSSANDVDYLLADTVWGGAGWNARLRIDVNGFNHADSMTTGYCYNPLSESPTPICSDDVPRQVVYFDLQVGSPASVSMHGEASASGLVTVGSGGDAGAGGTSNLSNTVPCG